MRQLFPRRPFFSLPAAAVVSALALAAGGCSSDDTADEIDVNRPDDMVEIEATPTQTSEAADKVEEAMEDEAEAVEEADDEVEAVVIETRTTAAGQAQAMDEAVEDLSEEAENVEVAEPTPATRPAQRGFRITSEADAEADEEMEAKMEVESAADAEMAPSATRGFRVVESESMPPATRPTTLPEGIEMMP